MFLYHQTKNIDCIGSLPVSVSVHQHIIWGNLSTPNFHQDLDMLALIMATYKTTRLYNYGCVYVFGMDICWTAIKAKLPSHYWLKGSLPITWLTEVIILPLPLNFIGENYGISLYICNNHYRCHITPVLLMDCTAAKIPLPLD